MLEHQIQTLIDKRFDILLERKIKPHIDKIKWLEAQIKNIGIWTDRQIIEWGKAGHCEPFIKENVNPASYDLVLSNKIRTQNLNCDEAITNGIKWNEEVTFSTQVLWPGEMALFSSKEFTVIPDNAIAMLFLKSSTGRRGVEHLHAGYGDPGFAGQWTLELKNESKNAIEIEAGSKMLQLVFMNTCIGGPSKTYRETGHYCDQRGPQPQWANNIMLSITEDNREIIEGV